MGKTAHCIPIHDTIANIDLFGNLRVDHLFGTSSTISKIFLVFRHSSKMFKGSSRHNSIEWYEESGSKVLSKSIPKNL